MTQAACGRRITTQLNRRRHVTLYELCSLASAPFLPVLISRSRSQLRSLAEHFSNPELLDAGGRRSTYTIGVSCNVTVLDVPPQNRVQEQLALGLKQRDLELIKRRRSNVNRILLEDMTQSSLPSDAFDIVACVEVLEHVKEDRLFLSEVRRVLRPHGALFLTTPNGDYIKNEPPNYNPDHVRHYTRQQLLDLLRDVFGEHVDVKYAVRTGKHRFRGLRSFALGRPVATTVAMISNLVNHLQSRYVEDQSQRTAHLVAIAWKDTLTLPESANGGR